MPLSYTSSLPIKQASPIHTELEICSSILPISWITLTKFCHVMIYRTYFAYKFNIFHTILPFENCKPASTSQEGFNIFLTVGKHDNKFLWLSASTQCCTLHFFISHHLMSLDLVFQLSHSFITHYRCYLSTFWNGFMYRLVNFLYLFLDVSYYWFIITELTANSIITHVWTKHM